MPDLAPDTIPWWPAVNADESARYLPTDAPGHAPVVTVLGGWPLILLTTLPLRPSPLLLSLWLVLLAAACTSAFWLVRLYQAAARSHRDFLAEFGTPRVVGAPSAEHSELGEHLTAELLSRYLTRLPGVRIFHGLSWPDSVFADIDHAVLCGRRLVLIESKVWPTRPMRTVGCGATTTRSAAVTRSWPRG